MKDLIVLSKAQIILISYVILSCNTFIIIDSVNKA